ncbi:MAG: mitochondrial fission ELM1 family protein [Alcanivoracaceae bacterium]|nr:mitochondrial fission ELM1 family protein [Alcanivoracaceae bacterium]
MKKLNHIWVFSDSIKGHEIQSLALASKIANNINIFHCGLRQPWLSFAPRILPGFGKNIIWEKHKPDLNQRPDAIITCGRRMAAVGKYFKRQGNSKHIQILNPGDNHKKYDILVCPEHDRLIGQNIVSSKGSLHNISSTSLSHIKLKCKEEGKGYNNKIVSVFIGNPAKGFFKELDKLATNIKQYFPNHDLIICGSRRTHRKFHAIIRSHFNSARLCWLSEKDGDNPYHCLLACSEVLIVTADSINMVSEASASNKQVIAIAQGYISPKHKRFIHSIKDRLSKFGDAQVVHRPIDNINDVLQQVLNKL